MPAAPARQYSARLAAAIVLAIVVAALASQRLIEQREPAAGVLTIVDGDTVRSGGTVYRLLGFDVPERGDRALCDKERELAERATSRLQGLVASGVPKLTRTACPCSAGTEGSAACNEGRACASLTVDGQDVGDALIREGLAQPFVCRQTGCPPRRPWC